ncbi:cupin domain-containing protein [Rhizobacter sp. SG703]|uniref:cupin domain-containing protein n=1 Tax=Rhizobacter sp. SG703 TaxID=2587140 RepID=UPI001FF09E81|nr:cupin domain-containing protein [Rhizobacter sp. SG703]
MRRHWQKRPLLIRQAVPGIAPIVPRAQLFELAAREDVESRLIVHGQRGWTMKRGPQARRALPAVSRRGWTLLVQGLDLHLDAARELLSWFRFVPDARLDDLMVSWASDGGGVGPHVDSYDVFLLQVQGRRRWRIGPVDDASLEPDVPLKILSRFVPDQEWLLEPGDMLYLPPGWGHDGVAEGECMTCSIGFRAAGRDELATEVLQRVIEAVDPDGEDPLYRDPSQPATDAPGQVPPRLQAFAADAVQRLLRDPAALACALGELLSEPKPSVWFDAGEPLDAPQAVRLDRRTRMMYDDRHVFINGDSFRAAGRDARLMRLLADERCLALADVARLSDDAFELLGQWAHAGWVRAVHET